MIFKVSARHGTQCTEAFVALGEKMLEMKKSVVGAVRLKNNRHSTPIPEVSNEEDEKPRRKGNKCC